MKKNQAIYRDLIKIAQLADHAARKRAKPSLVGDLDAQLDMMSYATLEFISAYLLKRHISLVKEISDQIIPPRYVRFIDEMVNDGPPHLKEYLDANMGELESLLMSDKD